MFYIVMIDYSNYNKFLFENDKDALTFAQLAKKGCRNKKNIQIELISDKDAEDLKELMEEV